MLLVTFCAALGASVGLVLVTTAHQPSPRAAHSRAGLVVVALSPWTTYVLLVGALMSDRLVWPALFGAAPCGLLALLAGGLLVRVTEAGAERLIWLACASVVLAGAGTGLSVYALDTPWHVLAATTIGLTVAGAEVALARRLARPTLRANPDELVE